MSIKKAVKVIMECVFQKQNIVLINFSTFIQSTHQFSYESKCE